MRGVVDVIKTDSYVVNVPDDMFEKVKSDMEAEFEDWETLRDDDSRQDLYNIFLNWHSWTYYKRKDKQNELINKSVLKYAFYYKERYGLDAPHVGHHIGYRTEISL